MGTLNEVAATPIPPCTGAENPAMVSPPRPRWLPKSTESPLFYPANDLLFSEMETAREVLVILSGQVKLSINSSGGRRLCLGLAEPGEILGLASAISGDPYEVTAEAVRPTTVAAIKRQDFLEILRRDPEIWWWASRALSRDFNSACGQLRTVGLLLPAHQKLAGLLLDLSETGHPSEHSSRFRFCLTHQQIGELIGASRETVTRAWATLKRTGLVALRGSILIIPDRTALKNYACSAGCR